MTTKTPVALYAGIPKQLQAGDNVATLVTDAAWTAKGDTIAGTGAGAAAITPVGTDGNNHIANSANSNGVGWSSYARNSNLPAASETIYANQTVVIPYVFTLSSGVNLTLGLNAILAIL